MNKKLLFSIVIIAAVIFGISYFNGGPKTPPPKNATIVAFGDSLTEGHGASPGNGYVDKLSEIIGRPIINEGVSGDTTGQALLRVGNVLARDPGTVIVLLGGNDYLRRIPKETTFANLHEIISKLKDQDIRILLLGVRGGLLRDTYESDFSAFAKAEKVPYIPNVLDGILGNTDLMYDSVHPNDKGYARIAEKVAPKLKEIIGK